jgi:hypothetical protein
MGHSIRVLTKDSGGTPLAREKGHSLLQQAVVVPPDALQPDAAQYHQAGRYRHHGRGIGRTGPEHLRPETLHRPAAPKALLTAPHASHIA